MKLYATVTSERASKSQGGNDYIIVDITANRERVGQLEIRLFDDSKEANEDEWLIQWRKNEDDDWDILTQGHIPNKGKQQKGDVCGNCGRKTTVSIGDDINRCERCATL